jgi:hypothetical protein
LLPFLKQKSKQTGVIVHDRRPDESKEEDKESDSQKEIMDCIKDCIISYSTNDIKSLAEHVKSLHDLLHMEMNEESSSDTNYALQNARAHKQE